jgi:hypothetical protein
MDVPSQPTPASRSIASLYFLVVAVLLLAMSQFTGTAADMGPHQTGMVWLSVIEADAPLASASLLIGPDVRLNSPEGVFTGPEGVVEFSSTLRKSFANLNFERKSTEAVNGLVIITFTMTGINTGSYLDLPARCAGVAVDGVAVLSVDDTRVREQWIGYDQSTLRAQIEAFNLNDPIGRPSCNFAPDQVPAPIPMPEPSTCVRKDRCDAWS